ncbi:MAG: hydrolase [Anaerolinea sp.]|nr:hydrolase [Anaerolinea sp.]
MILTNGKIITWEQPGRILEGHALRIVGNKIAEIARQSEILEKYPQEERLDAHSQYIMPGNICAHTHFYGAFSRGMGIPGPAPKDFPEILGKLWWSLDKALTLDDVRYSALVCLIDAVKHGTTTLIDHHASPHAISGSLSEIAQAVKEAGVRASLCYEVTDREGDQGTKDGIAENVRFINAVKAERNGKLAATFGLHASLTLSEKTLEACRDACPDDVGFHVHVAEHPVDEYDSLQKCGERVVDRLERHGILGPRSIAVHAVHVDVREIELLAASQTWVTHQPRSNMNNAVGMSQPEAMMRAGIKVCLGNDGFSNQMWQEWKTAYLAHKLWNHDPRRMSGTDVVQMAVYNNASLAEQQFGVGPIGILTPGAEADLIFVDYHPFTELTAGNLPWHIIFGFHESMVTTTMVGGKVLMHDRHLLTLDEEKITHEARRLSEETWKRYNAIAQDH